MTSRCIRTLILLLAMLLLPLAAPAQQAELLPGAEEVLARADAMGAAADYDGAVALLQLALARYPTYPRLYLGLANWQETRGLQQFSLIGLATRQQLLRSPEVARDLFETYGKAIMFLPDARAIRTRVNELTSGEFPVQLGSYGPLALPGVPSAFSYALSDPRLAADQRGVLQGMVTTRAQTVPTKYQRDPKYGKRDPKLGNWSYKNILYAYAYDSSDQNWHLRFRVIWEQAPGKEKERLQLAQLTAQLMLRLYGTVAAYTGLTPRFTDGGAVNVWLTEKGDAGGEAYNESIFLYNVGTPRSETEWVRELAHEYGHLTLPPIGGYTQPEWGANGKLGERLFMLWLTLNPEAARGAHPWVWALNSNDILTKRINPLITTFSTLGVTAPQMRGTDAAAMDAAVGMALYLERMRGSRYLTSALNDMRSPVFAGTNGFLQSVEDLELYLQYFDNPVVVLRLRDLPQDIPYRVFLRDGDWTGELRGVGLRADKLQLTVDDKPTPLDPQGQFTLTGLPIGWHTLRVAPTAGTLAPELTSFRLSWKQATPPATPPTNK